MQCLLLVPCRVKKLKVSQLFDKGPAEAATADLFIPHIAVPHKVTKDWAGNKTTFFVTMPWNKVGCV